MKIVFMGTPDFAVPSLKALHSAGHEILAVVTQPDKMKGRGKKVSFTPVKEAAIELGIDVYQPKKVGEEEFVNKLRGLNADVIIVAAFGQILPKSILEMCKYGCINVHASLLPKYRGAAPIQWAVINGEEKSGVTIMQMGEGLDTGDIISVKEIELQKKETGGSLFDKLAQVGASLLVETLVDVENGNAKATVQNEDEATYVGMIKKSMGEIDFSKEAEEIERLVRGLSPWPSAFCKYNDKILKIWDCDVVDNVEGMSDAVYGEVVKTTKTAIYVKTAKGAIAINELQLEGKKRMDTASFLLGYKVEKGTIFK